MDHADHPTEGWTPSMVEGEFDHLEFLNLFNCSHIPNVLFARASEKEIITWSDEGEAVVLDRACSPSLYGYSNLIRIINTIKEGDQGQTYTAEARLWSEQYSTTEELRERISYDMGLNKTKSIRFGVLSTVLLAWPEQWCEILWDEIEDQLWDVVTSTIVPFLAVLDADDIKSYLSTTSKEEAGHYWGCLLKFLLRVSLGLKKAIPPSFSNLIYDGFALIEKDQLLDREEAQYLNVLKNTTEILLEANSQPWVVVQKLQDIDHCGSKRSNAIIGLTIGSLQEVTEITLHDQTIPKSWEWFPISPEEPATLEILAHTMLRGDATRNISGLRWKAIPVRTKVLLSFCEIERAQFSFAHKILSTLLPEVEDLYGTHSEELLVVVAAHIRCCNAFGRENEGQKWAEYLMDGGHVNFACEWKHTTRTPQEAHFMIIVADSLLGQNNYKEAEKLLLKVLESDFVPRGVKTRATLRLCKTSRRLQKASSNPDDWSRLRDATKEFSHLSDPLKYECLEEVICFLSLLSFDDGLKLPQASEIVAQITAYHESQNVYKGSAGSTRNFLENLRVLTEYRNALGLFCISGPELNYCKLVQEAYPKAHIQFVEKIGAKNWQRSQRIRILRASTTDGDFTEIPQPSAADPSSESVFHDSGLGSSIGSNSKIEGGFVTLSIGDDTKSVISVASNMSTDEDSKIPPMPSEILFGKPFSCFVCNRTIRNVITRPQWERHVYWDLRPYTCIVDGCDADPWNFTSRADFKAHLIDHQVVKIWKCKKCRHPEESVRAARYHIAYAHRSSSKLNDDDDFDQQDICLDLSKQVCPFCEKIPGQADFVGHICHHLEDVSLSAIPKEGDLDESDKGSDRSMSVASSDNRDLLPNESEDIVMNEDEFPSQSTSEELGTLKTAQQNVSYARAHLQEGRNQKAEELFLRALAIRRRILGADHGETLLTQTGLAWILQRQARYTEAETIYRRTLGSMVKVFGPTHRETLVAQNGFAIVLTVQGRYVEAEALHRQVLRGREDTLQPDNHDTLQSINNLAEVLEGQDRREEAMVLYERAIEGRKRVLGEGHILTQQSINMLARMMQKIEGV